MCSTPAAGLFLPVPLYLPELGQSQDLPGPQQLHRLTKLPFVVFGYFKAARLGSRRLYGLDHTVEMQQGAGVSEAAMFRVGQGARAGSSLAFA